jgi:aryl-alcohol dehydrogenase-like predicted oxidoreductase
LKVLDDLTEKYNSSAATISLAWLIKNPLVTAPIASATNKKQLDETMKAVELNLSQEDMEKLNAAGS